jgi:ubiquinone/menaquinone biosynthesis C-methylase UbiE
MHMGGHTEAADAQGAVNGYFRCEAGYWTDIYRRDGIKEATHQERLRAALAFTDRLDLPAGARVLDVGCGAGYAATALAQRGFAVDAVDPVAQMIEATRQRALAAGVGANVATRLGDIHCLPFPDATFALGIALGVLPWLPHLDHSLAELFRVLQPGGHIIASVDARWQLRQMLDPLLNPVLESPRRLAARVLRQPSGGVRAYTTSLRAFRRALASHGFLEVAGVALGFGPFTMFKRELLPASLGLKLHRRLQALANDGAPLLRSSGSQYLVLARKHEADRPVPTPIASASGIAPSAHAS